MPSVSHGSAVSLYASWTQLRSTATTHHAYQLPNTPHSNPPWGAPCTGPAVLGEQGYLAGATVVPLSALNGSSVWRIGAGMGLRLARQEAARSRGQPGAFHGSCRRSAPWRHECLVTPRGGLPWLCLRHGVVGARTGCVAEQMAALSGTCAKVDCPRLSGSALVGEGEVALCAAADWQQ